MTLNDLPYGSVVEYRKKLYFKSRGMSGDIMTSTDGHWDFIKDGGYNPDKPQEDGGGWGTVNWKMFHVLYSPRPILEP